MTHAELLPATGDRFAFAALVLALTAMVLTPLVTSLAVATLRGDAI